jgi:hypothetical protein
LSKSVICALKADEELRFIELLSTVGVHWRVLTHEARNRFNGDESLWVEKHALLTGSVHTKIVAQSRIANS